VKLGVAKGSVSTALSELIAYQVVEKVNTGDARSPAYQSNTDLVDVINNVLRNRELKLTNRIQDNIDALLQETGSVDTQTRQKLQKMREMTSFAVGSLQKLLDNKTIATERFKIIMRLLS
jgi:DNA-binding transcriptional regulator GbsR (MarR family)